MLNLGTWLGNTDNSQRSNMLTVHMEEQSAALQLSAFIGELLLQSDKEGLPLIICIGTDRCTGDSLGPLTGWHLTTLLNLWSLPVYGTLDNPVHAVNLVDTIQKLSPAEKKCPVIAIDACLGQISPVGSIIVKKEPLQPGIGLKKNLPAIGDISISGIVNIGGYMEFQVLQNTRLSLVFKMARTIANAIFMAINNTYPEYKRIADNQ